MPQFLLWCWRALLAVENLNRQGLKPARVLMESYETEFHDSMDDSRARFMLKYLRRLGALHRGSSGWEAVEIPGNSELHIRLLCLWITIGEGGSRPPVPGGRWPSLLDQFAVWSSLTPGEIAAALVAAEQEGRVKAEYDGNSVIGLFLPAQDISSNGHRPKRPPPPRCRFGDLDLAVGMLFMAPRSGFGYESTRAQVLLDGPYFNHLQVADIVACLEFLGRLAPGGVTGSIFLMGDTGYLLITDDEVRLLEQAWKSLECDE